MRIDGLRKNEESLEYYYHIGYNPGTRVPAWYYQ